MTDNGQAYDEATVRAATATDAAGLVDSLADAFVVPFIGVAGDHRGQGIGSHLLADLAGHCDEARLSAYLEATSPANARLYRRHGFATITQVGVGGSPPFELMQREPQIPTRREP